MAGELQLDEKSKGAQGNGAMQSMVDQAWPHLGGALLEKLQRFVCGIAVRPERQLAHDLGDLGYMRELAWASLVDVLLQLLLDSSRRALRQNER